jgi:hypothetical protein
LPVDCRIDGVSLNLHSTANEGSKVYDIALLTNMNDADHYIRGTVTNTVRSKSASHTMRFNGAGYALGLEDDT